MKDRNYIEFWSGHLKGRDHSEVLDVDGRIILEFIACKCDGKLWTKGIWLRIRTNGRLL
jgi:hypothetical protein